MLGRVLDEAAAEEKRQNCAETEHLLPRKPTYGVEVHGHHSLESESEGGADAKQKSSLPQSQQSQQQQQQHPRQQQQQQHQQPHEQQSDGGAGGDNYGATGQHEQDVPQHRPPDLLSSDVDYNEEEEDDDDEEDETYAGDDTDEEDDHLVSPYYGYDICGQCWKFVRIVADVEDLWDSPNPGEGGVRQLSATSSRRKNFIVAFWFVVLATCYAGERSTFKFLVDQSGPFRLFAVEVVTATHATLLGFGLVVAHLVRWHQRQRAQAARSRNNFGYQQEPNQHSTFDLPLGLPVVDVGLMAMMDVISLMLVFLTGIYVSPTLTVILIQFVLPLTGFLMQFVHPQGRFACCRPLIDPNNNHDDDIPPPPPSSSPPPLSPPQGSSSNSTNRKNGMSGESGSTHDKFSSANSHQHDDHSRHDLLSPDPRSRNNNNNHHPRPQGSPIRGCAGLAAEHLWGSALIFLACVCALIPSFYTIIDPDYFLYADPIPLRVAYNSLFFLSACIPAAASQLYKEHVFLRHKQPVNIHKINLLISAFEFIFAMVLSPLVFMLQGLGSENTAWYTLYPSAGFSDNFYDGFLCFFRLLDENDQVNKYPEEAQCNWVLLLTLGHTLCIIMVGVAVDKIVNAGSTKVTHRGISAGIILAVVLMAFYDFHITEFSFGPFVDALNVFCLVLLILGSEIYHRVSLPESTFETVYPTLDDIYDND